MFESRRENTMFRHQLFKKKSGSASVLVIRISFWLAVSIHETILKRKQQCKQADTLYTTGKQWRLSVTPNTYISSSGVVRTP